VAFPSKPTPEWYVVDLFEHAHEAGASRTELAAALGRALERGAFDVRALRAAARSYGTTATRALIENAIGPTAA
jgi:hypothetical protein